MRGREGGREGEKERKRRGGEGGREGEGGGRERKRGMEGGRERESARTHEPTVAGMGRGGGEWAWACGCGEKEGAQRAAERCEQGADQG